MHNYYPILWVGAIIGVISTLLIVAAFVVKDGEKETGFERNMKDSEIMQRLMDYAKPFYRQLCAQLRVCSQAGGIPVYPRFSQPDNSESWDDAGNGI